MSTIQNFCEALSNDVNVKAKCLRTLQSIRNLPPNVKRLRVTNMLKAFPNISNLDEAVNTALSLFQKKNVSKPPIVLERLYTPMVDRKMIQSVEELGVKQQQVLDTMSYFVETVINPYSNEEKMSGPIVSRMYGNVQRFVVRKHRLITIVPIPEREFSGNTWTRTGRGGQNRTCKNMAFFYSTATSNTDNLNFPGTWFPVVRVEEVDNKCYQATQTGEKIYGPIGYIDKDFGLTDLKPHVKDEFVENLLLAFPYLIDNIRNISGNHTITIDHARMYYKRFFYRFSNWWQVIMSAALSRSNILPQLHVQSEWDTSPFLFALRPLCFNFRYRYTSKVYEFYKANDIINKYVFKNRVNQFTVTIFREKSLNYNCDINKNVTHQINRWLNAYDALCSKENEYPTWVKYEV